MTEIITKTDSNGNRIKGFISKYQHFLVLIILVAIAFIRGQEANKGVNYGYYGYDTDRDLGNVHNLLEGNHGKDLSYTGEYMWYNPLITYIEFAVVKVTGLSPQYAVVQTGPFLNILCPFFFYLMVTFLFNSKVALAATSSLIFFTLGNMNSILSASYTPWNYAGTFSQTLFYLAVILVCATFSRSGYFLYILTGLLTGIVFLGHTAPALILLLIILWLFIHNFILDLKKKSGTDIKRHIISGLLFCSFFILASMPFLYFVVGKYKLHMVNFAPAQWDGTGVELRYILHLIKQSISFSLLIALVGIYDFYSHKTINGLKREIVLAWFFTCTILYLYTNLVSILRINFGVIFPGIVPSFHFIFYLKALQSVFFGIGFCFILEKILKRIYKVRGNKAIISENTVSISLTISVLIVTISYFPIYTKRADFFNNRISRPAEDIEMYHWIINNTGINEVIVSNETSSLFPVMASGRKLVSSYKFMVNPYVVYEKRADDNNRILQSVVACNISVARELLSKYNVRYILMENKQISDPGCIAKDFGNPLFVNDKYSIYRNR